MDNTVFYIQNKTPIWCYTINYKTNKIIEHEGVLVKFCGNGLMFRDNAEKRTWAEWTLNSLSPFEGIVRGSTVWYSKPNYIQAYKDFTKASRKLSKEYDLKSNKSKNRGDQIMEDTMSRLHDNLRYSAMAKGIKISDLEKEMDVSPGYISREKALSLRSVYRASKFLDIPMETLIEEDLSTACKIEAIRKEIERLTIELDKLMEENIDG